MAAAVAGKRQTRIPFQVFDDTSSRVVGLTALVLGGTGATGKHLLKEVLASDRFSKVSEYGRSLTPESSLSSSKDKLEQKTIDYANLELASWKKGSWDVVFITYA